MCTAAAVVGLLWRAWWVYGGVFFVEETGPWTFCVFVSAARGAIRASTLTSRAVDFLFSIRGVLQDKL